MMVATLFFGLAMPVFSAALPLAPAPATAPATSPSSLLQFNPEKYPGIDFSLVEQNQGASGILRFVQFLGRLIKQLLAPVLVFLISMLGFGLINAEGNEEAVNKISKKFKYILAGIGIVIVAQFFADLFSLYNEQKLTFLSTPDQIKLAGELFTEQTKLAIRLLRYLLGGIAVFYTIKAGFMLIFFSEEETASKEKEQFLYGFLGFLLIIISEALVGTVYGLQTLPSLPPTLGSMFTFQQLNVPGGLTLIGNVTNLFLAIIGAISLFTLVVGGSMYIFTAGNEERGKQATKLIISSVIGLVIAFSAYTLVSEFARAGKDVSEREAKSVIENLSTFGLPSP